MIAILRHLGPDPDAIIRMPTVSCRAAASRPDGRWVGCRPNFFLPVRVLSRLHRRLFLERLQVAAFDKRETGLEFFGNLARSPLNRRPSSGILTRCAISNGSSICQTPLQRRAMQQVLEYPWGATRIASRSPTVGSSPVRTVASCFRWKDYRAENKSKVMTLDADEFIRRFLLHVLPKGFRRIRHFGFLANACRTAKLPAIRAALQAPEPAPTVEHADYRERYANPHRSSHRSVPHLRRLHDRDRPLAALAIAATHSTAL